MEVNDIPMVDRKYTWFKLKGFTKSKLDRNSYVMGGWKLRREGHNTF